jgi:hypothetical protein
MCVAKPPNTFYGKVNIPNGKKQRSNQDGGSYFTHPLPHEYPLFETLEQWIS